MFLKTDLAISNLSQQGLPSAHAGHFPHFRMGVKNFTDQGNIAHIARDSTSRVVVHQGHKIGTDLGPSFCYSVD
jgi:hypothetical protein